MKWKFMGIVGIDGKTYVGDFNGRGDFVLYSNGNTVIKSTSMKSDHKEHIGKQFDKLGLDKTPPNKSSIGMVVAWHYKQNGSALVRALAAAAGAAVLLAS